MIVWVLKDQRRPLTTVEVQVLIIAHNKSAQGSCIYIEPRGKEAQLSQFTNLPPET
jgi:hypothetical protein